MDRSSNLLDESVGDNSIGRNGVILIEDCVETSGAFVLHHLIKRLLSPHSSSLLIFVAFAQPFSHYDRILRKMGCNLVVQRDSKRLLFFDMLMLECPDGVGRKTGEGGLHALYGKIHKAVEVSLLAESNRNNIIMIDDISLMEVAANGSSNDVLDFLHYCHTLTTQFGCSFVVLTHEDIYSATERATLLLQMEYLADVLVKAEPLATGLAADVHGQVLFLVLYFRFQPEVLGISCQPLQGSTPSWDFGVYTHLKKEIYINKRKETENLQRPVMLIVLSLLTSCSYISNFISYVSEITFLVHV